MNATKRLTCLLVLISLGLISAVPGDDQPRWMLAVSLIEQQTPPVGQKVLTEPTVVVVNGKPFSFVSGGLKKSAIGGDDLEFGVRLTGTVTQRDPATRQLVLKMAVRSLIDVEHQWDTELTRTETIDIRTLLKSGSTRRLKCGGSRELLVRVDPVVQ